MAIHAHSIPAPVDRRDLLRSVRALAKAELPLPPLLGEPAMDVRHAQALHMRRALSAAIDHASALLDALDAAGADLEDDDPLEDDADAEPTLGTPEVQFGRSEPTSITQVGWARGVEDAHV